MWAWPRALDFDAVSDEALTWNWHKAHAKTTNQPTKQKPSVINFVLHVGREEALFRKACGFWW